VTLPIRVVACVIRRGDRLLLCRRALHKRHGGLWEFPGGKVEPGESDLEAVRRELLEELGVEVVEVGAVLFSTRDPGSPFVLEFLPVEIRGGPQALEHEEILWVPADDVPTLPLAPGDARFVGEGLSRWVHPGAE